MDFIAEKEPSSPQPGCNLRTLSAGSGTQIQHSLPRLHPKQLRGHHGAGFLNIVQPRLVKRMLPRLICRLIIIPVRRPGYLRKMGKYCCPPCVGPSEPSGRTDSLRSDLQRIQPQSLMPLFLHSLHKGSIFCPQQFLHPLKELLRQHPYSFQCFHPLSCLPYGLSRFYLFAFTFRLRNQKILNSRAAAKITSPASIPGAA